MRAPAKSTGETACSGWSNPLHFIFFAKQKKIMQQPLKGNLSIFKSPSIPKTLYNSKQLLIYKVTHLSHCIQNDAVAAYKAF